MKLRVKGNAVRLRLTRPEVARLHDAGLVEESAEFGPDQVLVYRVRAAGDSGPVRAEFRAGTVEVTIPCDSVRAWAVSDDVAIEKNKTYSLTAGILPYGLIYPVAHIV